jgi:Xaa-Pro dipeptidase
MGTAIELDHGRMRVERRQRLRQAMADQGVDALVLLGPANVGYAGVTQPVADAMRQHHEPVVVVVPLAEGDVHAFTAFPEGVAPGDAVQVHPPLALEHAEGLAALVAAVRELVPGAARVGVDELTGPMIEGLRSQMAPVELADGSAVAGAARILKTPDEVECIRRAQRINELAMYDVEAALRPGVRQTELSATFLRRAFELGATSSTIDPIWNITPRSVAAGSFTANAEVGFPLASNDRFLRQDDLVLCDTGITYEGYHSDFGKTWLCSTDPRPGPDLQACFDRWVEVIDAVYAAIRPGATGGDLVRAAAAVEPKHTLRHYYLGHGSGCESGEPPFIGSDLGPDYDESVVLAPGMVFVLEPVVWRDGVGGYRSEEVVVVTDDGFERLSTYGYTPFEGGDGR